MGNWIRTSVLPVGLLIGLVAVTFGRSARNQFVAYQDDVYVTGNLHLQHGFGSGTFALAFTDFYADQWHPLTWLAHVLDYSWFGADPVGHHVMNLLIHAVNVALVFLVLRAMTGEVLPSALVAALFAVHPLQVESVAWVSQKKVLLGAFFSLLTVAAHVGYARHPGRWRQALALLLFALALGSYPAAVVLPGILLLLDYWPLGRWARGEAEAAEDVGSRAASALVLEKVPMLVLAAVVALVTVFARAEAVEKLAPVSPGQRVGEALVSLVGYLFHFFLPFGMYLEYSSGSVSVWKAVGAGVLLLAVTAWALGSAERRPYAAVGWLWFLVALAPTIGIARIGEWSSADRYAYFALLGLSWGATWIAWKGVKSLDFGRPLVSLGGAAWVVLLAALSWSAQGHWTDSHALFEHTLAANPTNARMHYRYGVVLGESGRHGEALAHFEEAARLAPDFSEAQLTLAKTLVTVGKANEAVRRYDAMLAANSNNVDAYLGRGFAKALEGKYTEAIFNYRAALDLRCEDPQLFNNLGIAYLKSGDAASAIQMFVEAIRRNPTNPAPRVGLGSALADRGEFADALTQFEEALKLNPRSAEANNSIGLIHLRREEWSQAAERFAAALEVEPGNREARVNAALVEIRRGALDEGKKRLLEALERDPENVGARFQLAELLLRQEDAVGALEQYRKCLKQSPNWPEALNATAWLLATHPDESVRNGFEAILFAEQANQLTGQNRPAFLDSLAAAYAEGDKFDDAVRVARLAITAARRRNELAQVPAMEQRLRLYQEKQKYRGDGGTSKPAAEEPAPSAGGAESPDPAAP